MENENPNQVIIEELEARFKQAYAFWRATCARPDVWHYEIDQAWEDYVKAREERSQGIKRGLRAAPF